MSAPIPIYQKTINYGPGYFNNQRPNWIKAYAKAVKKIGREAANKQYPQVKNWVSSQLSQGKNARINYNSNTATTRTARSSTSVSSRKARRKTRRSRAN
jgi:hypothetical protein